MVWRVKWEHFFLSVTDLTAIGEIEGFRYVRVGETSSKRGCQISVKLDGK